MIIPVSKAKHVGRLSLEKPRCGSDDFLRLELFNHHGQHRIRKQRLIKPFFVPHRQHYAVQRPHLSYIASFDSKGRDTLSVFEDAIEHDVIKVLTFETRIRPSRDT